jgi:SAM-dependent methyltransferase
MADPADSVDPYAAFAPFYDWLASDEVMTGEPFWDRFGDVLTTLPSGARVLDCACGTGYNALALARRGFTVSGSDASKAMLSEARRRLPTHVNLRHCAWSDLPEAFAEPFNAVVCTGNSLMHAGDEHSMVAALTGISGVLEPGGLLLLDSRNWEKLRTERPLLQVPHSPYFRSGQAAVAVYTWRWPDQWDAVHRAEISVISTDGHETSFGRTHINFHPFRFEDLTQRLNRAGFTVLSHTFKPDTYVYDLTARLTSSTARHELP